MEILDEIFQMNNIKPAGLFIKKKTECAPMITTYTKFSCWWNSKISKMGQEAWNAGMSNAYMV
jgi:hypothetical protein